MTEQHRLDILIDWFTDNNLKWDKECLAIKIENGSFGVYAIKNIKKNETIVRIPKECILSTKNCGISNILNVADLRSSYSLSLALLYEIALGEKSPWYGYIQALCEEQQDLPMFWTEQEKALFKGTAMETTIDNDLNDIESDYHEFIEPLLNKYPYIFTLENDNDPYSFENFVKASNLIFSRAFEIDEYHEKALVPFADLFKHGGENEHVHFETQFEVCQVCGVLENCEHHFTSLEDEESSENEEENEGDAMDDIVFENAVQGSEEGDVESDKVDMELPDLEEPEKQKVGFWDIEDEREKKEYCNMVLDRDVGQGEEIFSNYGHHPNIVLLSKYGFCFDDNSNDEIIIGQDIITECCVAMVTKLLKTKFPTILNEEAEKMAIEEVKRRYTFFLKNQKKIFPRQDEPEEIFDGSYSDYQEECCGEDEDENEEEEEDDEDTHDEDDDSCIEEEPFCLYTINSNGSFENDVICLLHIMFVDEEMFSKFSKSINNALRYFEDLVKNQNKKRKKSNDIKRYVYEACHAIADFKRTEYFGNSNEWKSVEKEIEERKQVPKGSRKYYAMTYRISEKKIIQKAVDYYSYLIKEYSDCIVPSSTIRLAKKLRK